MIILLELFPITLKILSSTLLKTLKYSPIKNKPMGLQFLVTNSLKGDVSISILQIIMTMQCYIPKANINKTKNIPVLHNNLITFIITLLS